MHLTLLCALSESFTREKNHFSEPHFQDRLLGSCCLSFKMLNIVRCISKERRIFQWKSSLSASNALLETVMKTERELPSTWWTTGLPVILGNLGSGTELWEMVEDLNFVPGKNGPLWRDVDLGNLCWMYRTLLNDGLILWSNHGISSGRNMQLSRGLSVHFREESQKGPYKSSHDTCESYCAWGSECRDCVYVIWE